MTPGERVIAVIVTHHSGAVIEGCLRSLTGVSRIVVVDNASDDDTLERVARMRPDTEVIHNRVGVGYGNAANQGLERVAGEFALLVNPDAVLEPEAVPRLVAAADDYPDAGLFGPTIRRPDGGVEPSHDVPLFLRRDVVSRGDEPPPAGPCCAGFLSGAVTLLRMSAYRAVGPFDPNLFLYYEDDDFCLRLRAAGFALVLVPGAVVSHVGGGSVRPSAHYYWEKFWHISWSRLYLEAKYHGRAAAFRLAGSHALLFLGKFLFDLVGLRRRKAWRDLARCAGAVGYMVRVPASPTTGIARPSGPVPQRPRAAW